MVRFCKCFFENSARMLVKQIIANKYWIKLQKRKNTIQGSVYSMGSVEFETFKTYIKISPANSFIRLSNPPAVAPILFINKSEDSLYLYINYQGVNNLTIKNEYLLPLIWKFLNWLFWAKRFTQLHFISNYHRIQMKNVDECKTTF